MTKKSCNSISKSFYEHTQLLFKSIIAWIAILLPVIACYMAKYPV